MAILVKQKFAGPKKVVNKKGKKLEEEETKIIGAQIECVCVSLFRSVCGVGENCDTYWV